MPTCNETYVTMIRYNSLKITLHIDRDSRLVKRLRKSLVHKHHSMKSHLERENKTPPSLGLMSGEV
jgi:hypothetical protein